MIKGTLNSIRARIEASEAMGVEKREELLALLDRLDTEVSDLAQTREEQARSIAGFTDVSTHEAMRVERDPDLARLAIGGLESSVKDFEVSHPKLVDVVNRICHMLADIGI
jgi:hypothetical protein